MDRSIFEKDHEYFNEILKGEMGLLKSETAENRIAGVTAVQPKCCSLKFQDEIVKGAVKGVPTQDAIRRH